METKLGKVMNAVSDAQQHLSSLSDYDHLECVYIDRMLAKVVDLPTDGKQKNTRRNLQMIRDWMTTDGPGVVLLEALGQLYWRLADLNSKDFEILKQSLGQQQSYLALVQDPKSTTLVMQRVKCVQESKFNAFDLFIQELDSSSSSSTTQGSIRSSRSQSFTRTSSTVEIPVQNLNSPKVTKIRNEKVESTIWCLNAPISPNLGNFGNPTLPKNDLEHVLIDFYINCLCPRQTLITKSNTYVNFLTIAGHNPSTSFAILSLSASYIKDCLMSDSERYQQADHFYALKAVQALGIELRHQESIEGCLATGMLLVHHDIVNDMPEVGVCWTCHINMLDMLPERDFLVDSGPADFLQYQLILARTAQSISRMQETWPRSTKPTNAALDYVDMESQRICGLLGLSQELLSLIESTTALVADSPFTRRDYKMSCAARLEYQLANLHQWTTDVSGKALEVVNRTAETYRIAAQIYLQCRFFGLTMSHPTIIKLNAKLSHGILWLPVAGPLYTALYPIWPFFIAAVTCNANMRDTLYNRVWDIRTREKSNLGTVLQQISALWVWMENELNIEQRRQGWWEEMLGSVKPRAKLLSLG